MTLELPKGPLNYDDYAAIDDGRRYQVIEGELDLTPSPTRRHQHLLQRIWKALDAYACHTGAGEVYLAPFDVVLRAERPAVVLQPDVLYVCKERLDIITAANVQGAPDLAVEVLSPSNAGLDAIKKLALYAKYGVQEVWFIPLGFERVETLRLQPGGHYDRPTLFLQGENVTSDLLPGLTLSVDSLFEGL